MEPLLNVKQAAEILGIRPATVYQHVWKRRIPHVKVLGALRFRASDLEAWIGAHTVTPKCSRVEPPKGRV